MYKLKNKKLEKAKGITLIALVITIIVLLILAGVSIATLTGPNGLLSQADEARTKTDIAGAKEKVQLEVAGSYGTDGKIDKEKLEKNLQNLNGSVSEKDGYLYEVTVDGETFDILETGEVKETNAHQKPVVENTIKPGEIVTEEQGNIAYTKNGTAVIPVGFAIVPNLDDVSQGLVISDIANDVNDSGNQFVWIPVEGNYEINPAYVYGLTLEDDTNYLPEGITSESENVTKAKGFYISRYEAGKEHTDTLVSKKGADVWVSIAQNAEKAETDQLNCKDVAKKFSGSNSNVKSGLCTGIQWDMVMAFVNGKKDGENQEYDVTKYSSSRHKGSSVGVQQSGQNQADKVCNIYDLEGNCYEYVAEKNTYNTSVPYIYRGGGCNNSGPASNRNSCNGDAVSVYSFRFVLYIM